MTVGAKEMCLVEDCAVIHIHYAPWVTRLTELCMPPSLMHFHNRPCIVNVLLYKY